MSLLSRLREKQAGKVATATPATYATQVGVERRTVAGVATVAFAKSPQGTSDSPARVSLIDSANDSHWCLTHHPDRDPVEVACCPEATHAEILERHSDAVGTEPFTPNIGQKSAPMTASEEMAIRAWLRVIEENDTEMIDEILARCLEDSHALNYFLNRASGRVS